MFLQSPDNPTPYATTMIIGTSSSETCTKATSLSADKDSGTHSPYSDAFAGQAPAVPLVKSNYLQYPVEPINWSEFLPPPPEHPPPSSTYGYTQGSPESSRKSSKSAGSGISTNQRLEFRDFIKNNCFDKDKIYEPVIIAFISLQYSERLHTQQLLGRLFRLGSLAAIRRRLSPGERVQQSAVGGGWRHPEPLPDHAHQPASAAAAALFCHRGSGWCRTAQPPAICHPAPCGQ